MVEHHTLRLMTCVVVELLDPLHISGDVHRFNSSTAGKVRFRIERRRLLPTSRRLQGQSARFVLVHYFVRFCFVLRRFREAIPLLVFGSHCEDTTVRFSVGSLVEGVWFPERLLAH